MLALQYSRFGEPTDVIAPVEIAEPKAGPADVVLRMVRSPIHNHDLATIRGVYGYKPELPAVGGSEMLGVVDAIGSDVRGVASGARVATFAPGTWLERVVAAPGSLVPIPDAIDDDRACQLLAMPLSALVLFDDLHVEAGAWVVQNAANGAVGRVFLQVAQSHGVNVVNLVRRESAAAELRRYGARHVVVTADEGWQRAVRDIVGDGSIARIIDSVGGPQTTDLQALLGGRGELIIFGGLERQAVASRPRTDDLARTGRARILDECLATAGPPGGARRSNGTDLSDGACRLAAATGRRNVRLERRPSGARGCRNARPLGKDSVTREHLSASGGSAG